jgi:hypothetical protein
LFLSLAYCTFAFFFSIISNFISMQNKIHVQFSPTRLKQIKKIALSGSRAKLQILNGKFAEGFQQLKNTAQKFKSFTTDLADRIPQALAARISLDLFAHFEAKNSKKLGIPKGIVLGGVLALLSSLPAVGQDIFVTNTTDENDNAPPKSLRDAIVEANTSGIDNIIYLPNGSSHLLTLGNLPTIVDKATNGTLQIICTGSTNAMISGGNVSRPLTMDVGSDLTISKLTITSGSAGNGGGIYNDEGDLTISDCLITNNEVTSRGGGVYSNNNASVLIENSTISFNSATQGGGVATSGTECKIFNSVILRNTSSAQGGGINRFDGTLMISSSSISGNISNLYGGGLWSMRGDTNIKTSSFTNNQSSGFGGGMMLFQNTSFLQNVTISGNISTGNTGGGIYHTIGDIILQHVTFSGNSGNGGASTGGFENGSFRGGNGSVTLQNTIIANSIGADFGNSGGGTLVLVTGSIVEDGSMAGAASGDSMLNVLSGGVHTLQVGSPAIDTGSPTVAVISDQLGIPRGFCFPDIGAVEKAGGASLVFSAPTNITNTWIGCVNSDWGTAGNWSLGTVPTASDVVYVPVEAANTLIIDEVVTCAKLVVQIGAKCKVDYNAGGKLVVKF